MKVSFRLASYYAEELTPDEALALRDAEGWIELKSGSFRTANILRVAPFAEHCIGQARDRVDAWIGKRTAAVASSVAVTSDLTVPVPDGLSYRPYQKAGINFMRTRHTSLNADVPRTGKQSPLDTLILTPTGWIKMGDVQVGMKVVGSNGHPVTVTGVFPQGVHPAYRITLNDGGTTRCGAEHLWAVNSPASRLRKRPYTVHTTAALMRRGLQDTRGRDKWSLPFGRLEGTEVQSALPMYLIGYLLGNGSTSSGSVTYSRHADDYEVTAYIQELLGSAFYIIERNTSENGVQSNIINTAPGENTLRKELLRLCLNKKSYDKRVPHECLFASRAQRIELLRGLLDSDGSCKDNRTVFHTTNENLAKDVQQLVWSLGGLASVKAYARPDKTSYDFDYAVRICVFEFCPFHLRRKVDQWAPSARLKKPRTIRSIEYIGDVEQQCISVDAEDHLYITDDYIVTHNTIQSIGVVNTYGRVLKVLVVAPANAKSNWCREAEKWLVHKGTIGYAEGDDLPDVDFLSINYELLARHADALRNVAWDVVVFDEAHYLKDGKSQRTEICFGAGKIPGLNGRLHRLFLTGTPIYVRPIDMWNIVKLANPLDLGKSWWSFAHRYCDAKSNGFALDATGRSNEEELQFKLRSSFMIRREKRDIGHELKPTRQTVILPKTGLSKVIRAERNAVQKNLATLYSLLAQQPTPDVVRQAMEAFEEYGDSLPAPVATARRELGLAKVKMAIEFIEETLLAENKLVVFAHHVDVVKEIAAAFPDFAVIVGGMTTKQRDKERERFQNDPTCRGIVGNIQAMGVAIELSAADTAIFVEGSWVPADMDQAEERIWLPNKTMPMTIIKLVVEDSLECAINAIVEMRQDSIDRTLSVHRLPGVAI